MISNTFNFLLTLKNCPIHWWTLYITLIVNTVCCDKTVIQGATDLLQQPELCE